MPPEVEKRPSCSKINNSGENKRLLADGDDVPQLSNEELVLKFMHKHQIPLRRMEVYGGLIEEEMLTFGYSTVGNKLGDLAEKGDVKRVAINKDEGAIEDIPPADESDRRGYFLITDQGRERASDLPQ